MSDKQSTKWWLEGDDKPSLYTWALTQMTMGAAYAALLFFGVIAVILLIRAFSYLLPEDPYAAIDTGTALIGVLA